MTTAPQPVPQARKPLFDLEAVKARLAAKGSKQTRIFKKGEIAEALRRDVVGQDAACDLVDEIYSVGAARETATKPICAMFLAGPPGTGKSFIVECLHKYVMNAKDIKALIYVDCGKLKNCETGMAYLFGMAKGFVGAEDGGLVSRGIQNNPNAIILFDEFEKADRRIQESLLVALNSGFVEDLCSKTKIPCGKTAWFFTTNKNQTTLGPTLQTMTEPWEKSRTLKSNYINADFLSPEFADRVDAFLWLDRLTDENLLRMIGNVVEGAVKEFDSHFTLSDIDPDAVVHLYDALAKSESGTRELKRIVSRSVQRDLLDMKRGGTHSGRIAVRIVESDIKAVLVEG